MKTSMLTLNQAVEYLRTVRKINVTRQSIYNFAQQHVLQCEKIAGTERPVLLLIPTRLLDTYQPSARHQEAGRTEKKTAA